MSRKLFVLVMDTGLFHQREKQLHRTQKDKNEKIVSEASSPWSQDFLAF